MKKTTYIGPIVIVLTIITSVILLIFTSCESKKQVDRTDISFVPDTATVVTTEMVVGTLKMISDPHIIMPAESEPIMVDQIPKWEPYEIAFYKTKESQFTYIDKNTIITINVRKFNGILVEDRKEWKD